MEIMQYLLTVVVAFFGIPMGYVLSLIAPEELVPGKRFFQPFRYLRLIFPFIGILLFLFRDNGLSMAASIVFLFGLPVAAYESIRFVKDDKIKHKLRLLRTIIMRYIWFIPVALLPLLFSEF